MTDYVSVKDLVKQTGMSSSNGIRILKRAGITPGKRALPRTWGGQTQNRMTTSVTKEEAEKFLALRGSGVSKEPPKINDAPAHELSAQEWEAKGYVVLRTYAKGCPDLIIIPADLAGKIQVREIKSQTDTIKKEQYETILELRNRGLNADFEWR